MTTEQRLERLERKNRWKEGIRAVLGLAVVAALYLYLEMPRDLEVRSLKVIDRDGTPRAWFRVDTDGSLRLSLRYRDGAMLLGADADDPPRVTLFGAKGKVNWQTPED